MNIIEAFSKFKKIKQDNWAVGYLFLCETDNQVKRFYSGISLPYVFCPEELLATNWKSYYELQQRKLIDFSVNWYPTLESMDRNEKEFHADGWETFKRDSVDHNTGLMTHKLMMVKYEN
jgi:hypothetical protein